MYTHKTHEKYADTLLERSNRLKFGQILISAIVTGGLIAVLFGKDSQLTIGLVAALSTLQTLLNVYLKDFNLGELAQKHRDSALAIWYVREKYLSLITDITRGKLAAEDAGTRRDKLLMKLYSAYSSAPSTNNKAYNDAQKALQKMEDMTFSDEEIDKFLPDELKAVS